MDDMLMQEAPGQGPNPVSAHVGRRRTVRVVAALLPAAAVAVVACVLAVATGDRRQHTATGATRLAANSDATDPRDAAIRTAETIIRTAPMVPGAIASRAAPMNRLDEASWTSASQHVQRTQFWTAPTTVAATIAYLRLHRPAAAHDAASGTASGPGVPANRSIAFRFDDFRSIGYDVVAYGGGVAVRADAVVLWAPARSPEDAVPASVTSVDVLVVRTNPQLRQGAPTTARTLTGSPARALAGYVNGLPRDVPGVRMCPEEPGGERWFDRLVFHSSGPDATVLVDMVGCGSTTFRLGHRTTIELRMTYGGGARSDIDQMITAALGLPGNYGG